MVYERHKLKAPNDPTRKDSQIGFYTIGDNLDNLLQIVDDKVGKLISGESDKKIKARLIEIATDRLDAYFRYGGTLTRSIRCKDGRTVTAADLQKKLKLYQK